MRSILRGVRRRVRRLRRPRTRAIILMYHSISDVPCPWELTVSPTRFNDHMRVLSQRAQVLGLDEMLARLEGGTLPARSVAITFDDGYVDNLEAASPILERYGSPATVFVTAGLVGSGREFWWDELARLTLDSPVLPTVMELNLGGARVNFNLGADATVTRGQAGHPSWRFEEAPPTRRHLLLQTLWRRLQPLPAGVRKQALCDLHRQAPQPPLNRPVRRIMDAGEVVKLAEGGLVEIGAHTMTHPVLSHLSLEDQRREIAQSRSRLEEITGRRVAHFAYPHGGRSDYTMATAQIVREAGLASACTTTEDWLRTGADGYQLPRIHVPPVSAAGFERLLDYWIG